MKKLNKVSWEDERVQNPWEEGQGGGGSAGTDVWGDEGDGGGDDYSNDFEGALDDDDDGEGGQQSQGQVQLTPEQWMQVQKSMGAQGGQQAPTQQQQAYTQDQIDQMLRVYRADEALVEKMFGDYATPQQRVEALNNMIQGVVQHVVTVMQYSQQNLMQDLQGRFSPALDMVQEQKESNFTSALTAAYPTLKGHESVVRDVIQSLKAQGYKAKDGIEAGRTVAAQVERLLKIGNPQFQLRPTANPQNPQRQRSNSSMPPMAQQTGRSGGGGSSPGGGGSRGGNQKPGWNVFD